MSLAFEETMDTQTGEKDAPTARDVRGMHRMVLSLDLRRRFSSITVFGFACILGCTWEYAIVTSLGSLENGGSGGVIWLFFAVMFGMFGVVISLAEMASIAPTSGGQYHWVSEFAPPKYQRLASYGVGWFTALGWQASVAGNAVLIAQETEALVAFIYPNWNIPGGFNWLTMVLMIGGTFVSAVINTYAVRLLSWLEALMFLLHVAGFVALLVPLWVLGDVQPADTTFFTFEDNNGWGNVGLACLVGISGPVVTLVGGDAACHLAEETKDATKSIPLAMIWTTLINYVIGFVMTITILSVSGNYNADIAEHTGQPWVAVIYAATKSKGATIFFVILMIFLFFFCTINCITTTSRQLYAFARDGGMPFSGWLSRVDHRTGLPVHSLIVTFTITFLLSFIAAASSIAFANIVSISLVGLLLSYGSTIITMLFRRLRPEPLPDAYLKFSKPVGTVINVFALCFLLVAFVFIFFPASPNPTAKSFNWAVVVGAGVIIFAGVYYAIWARHTYYGPAVRIKQYALEHGSDEAVEVDISGNGKRLE